MTWRGKQKRGMWTAALALVTLSHCVEGGMNQNERTAGSGEGGVDVGFGELAIDPTGAYVLSRSEDALVYGDLTTGQVEVLNQIAAPERVAFAHEGHSIFATKAGAERGKVFRYDLRAGKQLWTRGTTIELAWDDDTLGTRPWLDVLPDDSALVLTFHDHIEVLDASTGSARFVSPPGAAVVDLDITPEPKRLVVTRAHDFVEGRAQTALEVYDLRTFARLDIVVPNCADELVLSRDGKRALLAPTTCEQDPVSVIDLESGRFVRNLPGFGPVALAPAGDLAVAFLDTDNLDEALFDDPAQIPPATWPKYALMLIDPITLRFDTVPLGDKLPRYTVSPDGKMLLVDAASFMNEGRIRVLDVKTRALREVSGPELRLENYVVTRDSRTVYLLDDGLYQVSLAEGTARAEALEFTPDHLNITPDDRTLVLREDEHTLWLFDTSLGQLTREMKLSL